MTKDELLQQLDDALTELVRVVDSFTEEELNALPAQPGSPEGGTPWTAGQVAQHLVLSNGGFLQMLRGPLAATNRPYDAGVEDIRRTLLNFDVRLTAPSMVEPPPGHYKKEDLLNAHQKIKAGYAKAAPATDFTATCTLFEIPGAGHLTGWEALHFVLYHTQRHLRQLRSIRQQLAPAGVSNE